jgi:hypothetical protein
MDTEKPPDFARGFNIFCMELRGVEPLSTRAYLPTTHPQTWLH